MLDLLFAWPDELNSIEHYASPLSRACCYLRLQRFAEAESLLLSLLSLQPDSEELAFYYCYFLLATGRKNEAVSFIDFPGTPKFLSTPQRSFLFVQQCLLTADIPSIHLFEHQIWKYATEFWPLHLAYAAYLIHLNFLDQAFSQLQLLPSRYSDCLEVLRLKSRILEKQQRFDEALLVLERCSVRFLTSPCTHTRA